MSAGLTAAHRAILHVICTRAWMHVQVNLLVWVCVQRVSNGIGPVVVCSLLAFLLVVGSVVRCLAFLCA